MGTAAKPSVCVVVVNWNGLSDTQECLASLAEVSYPCFQVLVVDNGSRGDDASILRAAFPAVTVLEAGENRGFTGGNNLGIQYALKTGADYILCLNNDTVVAPDFLGPLVQALEDDPQAGLAVSQIFLYGHDSEALYVGADCDFGADALRVQKGPVWHVMPTPELLQRTQPYETAVATGCALLARAEVMRQLGGFDDRYFAYFEDADLSLRVAALGLRRLVVPQSRVWHKEGRSTGGALSPTALFYLVRNTRLLAETHASEGQGPSYYRRFARLYQRIALGFLVRPDEDGRNLERTRAIRAAIQHAQSGRYGRWEETEEQAQRDRQRLLAQRPFWRLLKRWRH
jgi:GT2 family glycosyltransferase